MPLELTLLSLQVTHQTDPELVPSGLNKVHRSGEERWWTIYYKERYPEWVIEMCIDGVSYLLNDALCYKTEKFKRDVFYLASNMVIVPKEQFFNTMVAANHCCLNWLLFNQDIWNK